MDNDEHKAYCLYLKANLMLPKNLRLETKLIAKISRYGKRVPGEYFDTRMWFDDAIESPKFAISVSTKIDKRSTVRNRIKRKLRAVIQEIVKEANVRKANYLLIVKSVKLVEMNNVEIKKILIEVLQ